MSIKNRLYYYLVDSDPRVKSHYEGYIMSNTNYHRKHRIKSWLFLKKLRKYFKSDAEGKTFPLAPLPYTPREINIYDMKEEAKDTIDVNQTSAVKNEKPVVTPKPPAPAVKPPTATKNSPKTESTPIENDVTLPEYKNQFRHTIQQMTKICMDYDVISFDIFDTLIFRNCSKPTDVFEYVELKYNIPDFKKMRIDAEKEARRVAPGHEVTISEIYHELYKIKRIDIDTVMEYELQAELKFTYANPYMKRVYDTLIRQNKTVIAVSNMYLPQEFIEKLLKNAGYEHFDKIYVSCDYHMSKGDKLLYAYVSKNFIKGRKVLHIGDNYRVDCLNAKESGWQTYHYLNCDILSDKYRPVWKASLAGSIYKSIIAHNLHSGMRLTYPKDKYYEFGFTYGGIIVCGFCEYLEKLAKEKHFDKYIFLARDGDIVQKVYRKHFKTIDNDYMVWSRFMSTYLCLKRGIGDLFTRNVNPIYDMVPDATIEKVLININCEFLEETLKKHHLSVTDRLTKENIELLKNIIAMHEDEIIAHFEPMAQKGCNYISEFIKDKHNICLMDVGWSGKSILSFEEFIKDNLSYDGEVSGAMIGAFDRELTNKYIDSGKLNSYMFSVHHNKNLLDKFAENYFNKTIFIETVVTSPVPSALAFETNDSEDLFELKYGNALSENNEAIKSIHKGIIDFADAYYDFVGENRNFVTIQAEDSFMPIYNFSINDQWIKYTFSDYKFDLLSGFGNAGIQDFLPNILH